MSINELKENAEVNTEGTFDGDEKKSQKREKGRFEFALFINDFLICKRNFPINGYVEKSMHTPEFKNEVDKIVELIDNDLKSKSRVYTHYHLPVFETVDGVLECPDWEPEIMTEPLAEEGTSVFKFVVYDNGIEVLSKIWDGRYYPMYVRKNVDLTNRQVKILKGERVNIYDKDRFFDAYGAQLSGDLYILKQMIADKEDLIPMIQKMIYEVCSSFDGYYEKISDYHAIEEYNNCDIKRDENGNGIYTQKVLKDADGNDIPVFDAFGNPWMVPVLEKPTKSKRYNFNIDAYNKKIDSVWGAIVAEKTRKYMNDLYVSPKDKYHKKKSEE